MQHDRPLLEWIPNISAGRDPGLIDELVALLGAVPDLAVLHRDEGYDANRTVLTCVGSPEAVVEGAFRLIEATTRRIDLRRHRGAHPRLGATDVSPFVPLAGLSLAQAAAYARRLGERVGRELGLPVFLYEAAATRPERRNLATIRRGEFEGLAAKLRDPAWRPDYGPPVPHPSAGAVVIGARPFLIAYNINLASRDVARAKAIAADLRESGTLRKTAAGETLRSPGRLPGVKAIGWLMDAYDCAQVSTNIVDPTRAALHTVYETTRELAAERGETVTGSELIGMIPRTYLLAAGRFYQPAAFAEASLLDAAVAGLNLRDKTPFDWRQRVIEHRLRAIGWDVH